MANKFCPRDFKTCYTCKGEVCEKEEAAKNAPSPEMPMVATVKLTLAEIQSRYTRVDWAEGLILLLPDTHEGRNSWLMNYGKGEKARELRAAPGHENFKWSEHHQALVEEKK